MRPIVIQWWRRWYIAGSLRIVVYVQVMCGYSQLITNWKERMTIRFATKRKMSILPTNSGRTELVETLNSRDSSCDRRTGANCAFGHRGEASRVLGLTLLFSAIQGL